MKFLFCCASLIAYTSAGVIPVRLSNEFHGDIGISSIALGDELDYGHGSLIGGEISGGLVNGHESLISGHKGVIGGYGDSIIKNHGLLSGHGEFLSGHDGVLLEDEGDDDHYGLSGSIGEEHIGGWDEHIGGLNGQIGGLDGHIEGFGSSFGGLSGHIGGSHIAGWEEHTEGLNSHIGGLCGHIEGLSSHIGGLNSHIGELDVHNIGLYGGVNRLGSERRVLSSSGTIDVGGELNGKLGGIKSADESASKVSGKKNYSKSDVVSKKNNDEKLKKKK